MNGRQGAGVYMVTLEDFIKIIKGISNERFISSFMFVGSTGGMVNTYYSLSNDS